MKRPFLLLLLALLLPGGTLHAAEKLIHGLTESVYLHELDVTVMAKLDTGAETASLSALNIERFRRNGTSWVRFNLGIDRHQHRVFEKPLARISRIKRRAGDIDSEDGKTYTPRPVIHLEVCMGEQSRTIEVNLTDRSAFAYPLLLGSEALTVFDALVDPSISKTAGQPSCNPAAPADE